MYWVCIMCLVLEWKIIKQAFFWLWRVDPEKIHLMCMPKRNLSAKMDSPWPTKSPNFMSNRLAEAFLRNLYTGKNLWLKSWLPHRDQLCGETQKLRYCWSPFSHLSFESQWIPSTLQKDVGPSCRVTHYQKNVFLRPNPVELVAFGG